MNRRSQKTGTIRRRQLSHQFNFLNRYSHTIVKPHPEADNKHLAKSWPKSVAPQSAGQQLEVPSQSFHDHLLSIVALHKDGYLTAAQFEQAKSQMGL